jgi:hypothetical protein
MVEVLCTGIVSVDKMQQIVTHCHFGQDALFLAEQLPNYVITGAEERKNLLRFTYFKSSPSCSEYTSGRIFQEDRELRWEMQGKRMRVVYVGQADESTDLQEYGLRKSAEFDSLIKSAKPKYYYLFGERLRPGDLKKLGKVAEPGDFAVLRIPRILRYPTQQNNQRYVRLVVCEYLEAKTNRLELFRFQRLETMGETV